MKKSLRASLMMVALLIGATIANAQQAPDPRVADLVQAGKIRVGLFSPANLLDDITNTRRISAVVLRGAAVDRAQPVLLFVPRYAITYREVEL